MFLQSARGVATAYTPATAVAAIPKEGEDIEGEVVKVTDMGITLQVRPQLTGFVHKSRMTEKYIDLPSDMVKVGEMVTARVLEVAEGPPIFLKLTMITAGRLRFKDLRVGREVSGEVKKVMDFGAILDIGAEVDAMLHRSQMKEGAFVADARVVLEVGDKVTAIVWSKDDVKRKVELTMKSAAQVLAPMESIRLADIKEGHELGGVVTSVMRYGAFVNVGAELDGLVHVRNINRGMCPNISAMLQRGDRVTVKVLNMSSRDGRMQLLLASPLTRLPSVEAFADIPEDLWLKGVVIGMDEQHGSYVLVAPPYGGESVNALLRDRWLREGETVGIGDHVQVRVLKANVEYRNIYVTTRADLKRNTLEVEEQRKEKGLAAKEARENSRAEGA